MDKVVITTKQKLDEMVRLQSEALVQQKLDAYEMELQMKQASLATLQAQINPHFLYNTLECIRGMALLQDQEEIADLALSLSRFFRYSISGKSDMVTLRDEIENVENYIRIQQYRFRNRFVLRVERDESLDDALLPKLTLQPVVENAILHGLGDVTEGGQITLKTAPAQGELSITISDNGCGMDANELEALIAKVNGAAPDAASGGSGSGQSGRGTGIGMQNVNRRLKLRFGERYGMSIYSCKHMGTDVEILIPHQISEKK